jgi:hypothetical protein
MVNDLHRLAGSLISICGGEAIAAAERVLQSTSPTRCALEFGRREAQISRDDKADRLAESWEEANDAAIKAARKVWPKAPNISSFICMRPVLTEPEQIAKVAWIEQTAAELKRQGLSEALAQQQAVDDWKVLTTADENPTFALAFDPGSMARQTAKWLETRTGMRPALAIIYDPSKPTHLAVSKKEWLARATAEYVRQGDLAEDDADATEALDMLSDHGRDPSAALAWAPEAAARAVIEHFKSGKGADDPISIEAKPESH